MQRQPLPLRVLVIFPASIPAAQSRLLQILPIQNNCPNLTFIWRTQYPAGCTEEGPLKSPPNPELWLSYRYGKYNYGIMPQFTAKARAFFSNKPNSHMLDMRPLLLPDAQPSSQRGKAAVYEYCTCARRGLWTCCLRCC
jgi:hypothetical protein